MGTREDFLGAYELVRSGRARVHVDRVFPLAETRAAHERLEAGEQLGKIVLDSVTGGLPGGLSLAHAGLLSRSRG